MRLLDLRSWAILALVGLGACAQQAASGDHSAPHATFSGPDYITIVHDPTLSGMPPFEVMAMAERYCAAAGKSAAIAPHGRHSNATAFICVTEGEEVK